MMPGTEKFCWLKQFLISLCVSAERPDQTSVLASTPLGALTGFIALEHSSSTALLRAHRNNEYFRTIDSVVAASRRRADSPAR